ncbi:glucose-1-phosphate thymidylyltransferase [Streptomyces albofaciens JCM 4342]|uniref:glucose-1-phosphate thymidylyltransferase n=1 Tax=Streptomyces albofaciens TaxID=66866 RepID=UPI00123BF99B|nr:glucose-1-phosphate thymidylyltransferase [Streptomyces albofaciens]KAA6213681.1 glucose-1-phosphate thymidylyltransferase [Streptomyces albofaciens JCM 4342]
MKALVLSGGTGTRLRPFTYAMPKQLIPVAGKPVLRHVLENIRELGITDIGIVVDARDRHIAAALGDGADLGVRLTFLRQEQPLGLAHCVALGREFLGTDDFLLHLGDNVLPEGIGTLAARFAAERPAAQLTLRKVPDPRRFGVAELDADGAVLRVTEKPDRPRSDLALVGVYFFTAEVHRAVAAIAPGRRGELEITDAVQWLIDAGAEVRAGEYGGYWRDIGCADDVLACNRRLLEDIRPVTAGTVDAASRLSGPVVIEAGARVTGSVIEGPALVGAGTVVEDSRLGPYTALGRDCVLRRAGIADSVTLDGVTIDRVGGLHGSLIGRAARVGRARPGDGRNRLLVGDDSRIEVAA